MNPVAMWPTRLAALANMVATGGVLATGKVHLFAAPLGINPGLQLSDFVEATFTGYAPIAIGAWGAPYIWVDQLAHVTAPGVQFQATDAAVPNTIYGAYITNTAGTVLLFAVQFAQPVPVLDASHAVYYTPDFIYGT